MCWMRHCCFTDEELASDQQSKDDQKVKEAKIKKERPKSHGCDRIAIHNLNQP